MSAVSLALAGCSEDVMDRINQDTSHTNSVDGKFILADLITSTAAGFSPYMRVAEPWFCVAEASMLGWNTGISAEDAYNKAVTYSMEENSVSAEDIADYLANAGKFTNDKKQIYYEEWVAMFKQGMEGWSLYRRTGVPDNLYPAPGRPANYSNHNVPPFRSPYPDKERNLNNANCAPFDAEVVDNLWGKQMWWDTRTGVH